MTKPTRTNINAWINDNDEYRYNVEAGNGKIIQGAHQGFNSRQAMEHNMKLLGINPDKLPDRISRKED